MSQPKERCIISRNGLKGIVSTLTDQQIDELFISSTGKRVGILGKNKVIESLDLTDEQKTAINNFRFEAKPNLPTPEPVQKEENLYKIKGDKLIKNISLINTKIKNLKEQIAQLELDKQKYNDEIKRRSQALQQ